MNGINSQPDSQLGRRMLWVAALGLLGGLFWFFSVLEKGSGTTSVVDQNGHAMVILDQNRNGHYQVDGRINGQQVRFMVDTGATDVAIPVTTARTLGLTFGPPVSVMTAGGRSRAWMTRLDEVSIGEIHRRNVRATIASGDFDGVLLGMSFLRFYDLQQQDGQLVIREANE